MVTRFLKRIFLAIILVSMFLAGCGPASDVTEEAPTAVGGVSEETACDYKGDLVISTYGGTSEEFSRNYVVPSYNEICPDVTVVYDVGGMSARLTKLIAQKDNPEVNLFHSTPEAFYQALNEGLLVEIDQSNIPEMANIPDWAKPEPQYGAGVNSYAYSLGYDPEFFGDDPPTSWLDLWRSEVQGKVILPAIGHSMMTDFIIAAAETHGGSMNDVMPGINAIAELKPVSQTFFYTDWIPIWESGDAVMVVDFDIYINRYKDEQGGNIEFLIPEEGAFGLIGHWSVVKGTEGKLKFAAETYINLLLTKEVQADNPEGSYIAPVRPDITLSEKWDELLATYGSSLDQVRWTDPKFKADNRAEWTELMNQIVAPAWGE